MTAIMITSIPVGDGNLVSSNVPENDYVVWDNTVHYNIGDRVISTSTHKVYESVIDNNVNNDPTLATNQGTLWFVVGSTNRWRGFDQSVGQKTTNPDSIDMTLGLPSRMDAVAFIGTVATEAQVVVRDSVGTVTYDETRTLLDVSGISSWLDFFTYEETFDPEVVFNNINGLSGFTAQFVLTTIGGIAEVAEIVAGESLALGELGSGTRSGFTDYSRRDVDDFGNITIVKRATARRAEWELAFPTESNRRIQRALELARGAPAFFYPGDDMIEFYVSVHGVVDDFYPALEGGGTTIATLSLTGYV